MPLLLILAAALGFLVGCVWGWQKGYNEAQDES